MAGMQRAHAGLQGLQSHSGVTAKAGPGIGQHQTSASPMKQTDAQQILKLGQTARQGGLRQTVLARHIRQRAFRRDVEKTADMAQLYRGTHNHCDI